MDKFTLLAEAQADARQRNGQYQPLTAQNETLSLAEAYAYSKARASQSGSAITGRKVGVTSKTLLDIFKVSEPVFGYLTQASKIASGAKIPAGTMVTPKAEGEIAFVLTKDLREHNPKREDILAATQIQMAIEIVDGRIAMPYKIEDLVADNSAAAHYILAEGRRGSAAFDFAAAKMTAKKNGEVAATGVGSEVLGDPINSMIWLAGELGKTGDYLRAGEIVLSGSFAPVGMPFAAGDLVEIEIEGLGSASFKYG